MSNINEKSMPSKLADAKTGNFRYTKDGALIEGVAVGGEVLIVQKDVQWVRDVLPYFYSTFVVIFTHIIYTYTGNLMFPVWMMYLVVPLNQLMGKEDNTNISASC